MDFGSIVTPSPLGAEGFVELSRTPSGTLFRKHILTKGELIHPTTKKKIAIDDAFVTKLKDNFDKKYCDIVQVPLANDKNEHVEDPTRNLGEVVGIEEADGKIYALIDARKNAEDFGKTLLGASAMMHLDYTDTHTDTKVGPTLLHVAVTNRPYVTDLEPFEQVVSASAAADSSGETVLLTPVTAEEPTPMDRDELIAKLKAEHGIDVPALQAQANAPAALSAEDIARALGGVVSLSAPAEEVTSEDIVGAIAELAQNNVALSNSVSELKTDKAVNEVKSLVLKGFIVPAQEDAMTELRLSNPDLFLKMLPSQPVVALSMESGALPPEDATQELDVDAEIAKLAAKPMTAGFIRS